MAARPLSLLLLMACGAHGHYHTEPYSTDRLIEQLRIGHHMDVDGVPADFECAWRTAAMARAKEIQPFLSTAQQKSLHDALELGASGDDHKGHTHGPCQKRSRGGGEVVPPTSFEALSWVPQEVTQKPSRSGDRGMAPRRGAAPSGTLLLQPTSAEELVAGAKPSPLAQPAPIVSPMISR